MLLIDYIIILERTSQWQTYMNVNWFSEILVGEKNMNINWFYEILVGEKGVPQLTA